MNNVFIAIPTYNGGDVWGKGIRRIKDLYPENLSVSIVDSGSKDNTVKLAEELGFSVTKILSKDFNHGGTRNMLVKKAPSGAEIVIFITQDAIIEKGCFENIASIFDDPGIGCAYGRQLPHDDASLISTHARHFNYPETSYVYSLADAKDRGLKTVFMSNSFAAYRISIFNELGGFPSNTILSEDMYFAAKCILAGYKVAYVSSAQVKHSHNYSSIQEFKRYFDIGAFHGKEKWIFESFGGAGGEGLSFIKSEFLFLMKNNFLLIPLSFFNNAMKIIGYKLGKNYKKLPEFLIKRMSMHSKYWVNNGK